MHSCSGGPTIANTTSFPRDCWREVLNRYASATSRALKEPNLFGKLIKRSVVDNLVVDQEVVTRTFADGVGEVDVLAIYQIESGKIAKAWFKMGSPRLARDAE